MHLALLSCLNQNHEEIPLNLYETTFISRQDLAPSQVDALSESYANIIRDHGGSVSKTEYCGLRTLAYPIRKSMKGHYVHMNIRSNHDAIQEIERQMLLSEDVMRVLTVRVESHQDGPSPLLKAARNSNIRDISITTVAEETQDENKAPTTTPEHDGKTN